MAAKTMTPSARLRKAKKAFVAAEAAYNEIVQLMRDAPRAGDAERRAELDRYHELFRGFVQREEQDAERARERGEAGE